MTRHKITLRSLLIPSLIWAMSSLFSEHAAWATNNCAAPQGGIGGTGAAIERGGIGGTGTLAKGGGIGGTGERARDSGVGGTGIVGIITGFASICVNGIEVHYDPSTPLEINGHPATARDLAVGQLVQAEASGTGDEVMARNISVQYAVAGPIGHISTSGGQIQVMGQAVQVTEHTITPSGSNLSGLQAGDFVRVSGMRKQDGVIMAARIERVATQGEVSVSGPVSRAGAHDFSISGLRIAPAPGKIPEGLAAGREVQVYGQLQNGLLKAERIEVAPTLPFGGREQRLELQGYLHASDTPGRLSVGRTQMEIAPQALAEGKLAPDQLVHVSARLTPDRRLVAEHIEIARDYFQRRELHNLNKDSVRHAAKDMHDKNAGGKRPDSHSDNRDHAVKSGGSERVEKPEKTPRHKSDSNLERVERLEHIGRIERPEKIELPERIERVELPERIERVELPETH